MHHRFRFFLILVTFAPRLLAAHSSRCSNSTITGDRVGMIRRTRSECELRSLVFLSAGTQAFSWARARSSSRSRSLRQQLWPERGGLPATSTYHGLAGPPATIYNDRRDSRSGHL